MHRLMNENQPLRKNILHRVIGILVLTPNGFYSIVNNTQLCVDCEHGNVKKVSTNHYV